MLADSGTVAFISLLRDHAEARGLAMMLEGLARSDAGVTSMFLVPDVRGVDFFAAPPGHPALDRWWAQNAPARAIPVYLLSHEKGLAGWLRGLDGVFFIAAGDADARMYAPWTAVRCDPATAPLALAEAVVTRYSTAASSPGRGAAGIFDRGDAAMIAMVRGGPSGRRRRAAATPAKSSRTETEQAGRGSPTPDLAAGAPPMRRRPVYAPLLDIERGGRPSVPDPLDLLAADSAQAESRAPIWTSDGMDSPGRAAAARPRRQQRLLPLVGRGRTSRAAGVALATLLLARAPTIVVVGSRKGGVGKTSHAAGMAIVAGGVLDTVGHTAALVDANVANPDAWGQLNLPASAPSVRDVVAALATGTYPRPPVHSLTPALACYPERREGVDYSRTDIRRLASHLRARYTFVVVDMSNRLPDPLSGPEASVAAFWLEEADALVLPTAMSRQDFSGVLDYLDVRGLPPTIVPCIVSNARRNRRHPVTREYLDAIQARVSRVLEVPDDADSVRLAGMEGVPVQQVSARLRAAYWEMTEAVARLPSRAPV